MQALVVFHDKSVYHEIYDLADTFWLENILLCSQDVSYLEQQWSVVSHLLSCHEYNEEEIVFHAAITWLEYIPMCRAIYVEDFLSGVTCLPQLTPAFLSDTVLVHPF